MRKFLTVFGLAAFAVGCLRVQRMPDGSANYGGIAGPRGVVALNTSGAVMTAVHEAARSGQPMSAVFDGQGGGSVQVGRGACGASVGRAGRGRTAGSCARLA